MMRIFTTIVLTLMLITGAATLYGHYQLRHIAEKCPAPGEFITVDQNALHYIKRDGTDTAVVFLHGASSNAREWQLSMFETLPEKYTLVAIDRPGLGHSERSKKLQLQQQVQLLHQTIIDLKLIQPVLVVHSLSGAIGARLLTDYPEHYKGLVIVAGATYPIGEGSSWYTRLATIPVAGHIFRYAVVPALGPLISPKIVAASFSPQPVVEGYAESSCLELLYFPDRFLANSEDLNGIRAYLDISYPLYTTIKAPVSLVYGTKDNIIAQFTHAGGFQYQVPHARYIMLKDIGHLPHYFHQETIAAEIERIHSSVRVQLSADDINSPEGRTTPTDHNSTQ